MNTPLSEIRAYLEFLILLLWVLGKSLLLKKRSYLDSFFFIIIHTYFFKPPKTPPTRPPIGLVVVEELEPELVLVNPPTITPVVVLPGLETCPPAPAPTVTVFPPSKPPIGFTIAPPIEEFPPFTAPPIELTVFPTLVTVEPIPLTTGVLVAVKPVPVLLTVLPTVVTMLLIGLPTPVVVPTV